MSNLKHIAIIPDGNRRWAKKRGLQPSRGHYEGAKTAENIARASIDLKIPNATIWGSSYDNLTKRPETELKALNKIYSEFAHKLATDKDISKNKVRVRFLGEWESILDKGTINTFREAEEKTRLYDGHSLNCLIGYNGDREMINAIKSIQNTNIPITDEAIKRHLWTGDLPPVDLLIRTGDEPHLSTGFMMWHIKYAELYFSPKMWPDFTKEDLIQAIEYYATRRRRFGE